MPPQQFKWIDRDTADRDMLQLVYHAPPQIAEQAVKLLKAIRSPTIIPDLRDRFLDVEYDMQLRREMYKIIGATPRNFDFSEFLTVISEVFEEDIFYSYAIRLLKYHLTNVFWILRDIELKGIINMIQRWFPRIIVVYALLIIIVQPVLAQSSIPKFIWTKITEDQSSVISISPNGKQIVFGSPRTNYLTLIDWETKHIIWQVPLSFSNSPDYRAKSNWSPDGKYIATLTDKLDIYVFNAFTGEHITQIEVSLKRYENLLKVLTNSNNSFNGDSYTDLKWSADGQQLAVMARGYVVVYDLDTDEVKTVVDLVGLRVSSDLHNYLSWFDWSPDGSKFAAFHARLDDKREGLQAVQPIEIVMGFWNKHGALLFADEPQNSRDKCVPNGQGVFQGATVDPLGVDVVWALDNKTIAVSSRSYVNQSGAFTVCTLHDDGTLSTKLVSSDSYPKSPTSLHWTIDQKWLIGIVDGCSLMIADVSNDFRTYLEPLSQSSCGYESSWSQDDHYVAVGGYDGISVGAVEFPK